MQPCLSYESNPRRYYSAVTRQEQRAATMHDWD
jgi:hypothetical protein